MQWRHQVNGTIIFQSRELVWMTPAGYVLIFALAAVPVACLLLPFAALGRRDIARRVFAGVFVFLGAFSLLLLFPRLHVAAQLALAAGVSVRLSGMVVRRSVRSLSIFAATLAALTVVLGAGSHWLRDLGAGRQLAALPPTSQAAPNVLLIILDTVRGANMSFYGYERSTMPALERWASEGALFEHAFSPASWTGPSHASMFTGFTPSRLGMSWRTWETRLNDSLPTIAETFRDNGYATGGFVANLIYTAWDSGLGRGFIQYRDQRTSLTEVVSSTMLGQTPSFRYLWWSRTIPDAWEAVKRFDLVPPRMLHSDHKPASLVSDEFLGWQEGLGGRPFFAFLNYFDAHGPYRAPREYRDLFGPDSVPLNRYDAAIRYIDDELDRVFTTLADRGVLDETIVIVTSDHGEEFGERGTWGHGQSVYTELVRVPLVLRYPPSVPRGARIGAAVSLRDVAATLLDLAGIQDSRFPGRPWSQLWSAGGRVDGGEPVISETTATPDTVTKGRITRSAAMGDLHLVRWYNGKEELFNYRSDPAELQFLPLEPSPNAALVAALRAAMLDPLPR
jgi:arylsulfatase A-like enzyme